MKFQNTNGLRSKPEKWKNGICFGVEDTMVTFQGAKYGLPKQNISLQIFKRLPSTNFTWSTIEYFVPYTISYSAYADTFK